MVLKRKKSWISGLILFYTFPKSVLVMPSIWFIIRFGPIYQLFGDIFVSYEQYMIRKIKDMVDTVTCDKQHDIRVHTICAHTFTQWNLTNLNSKSSVSSVKAGNYDFYWQLVCIFKEYFIFFTNKNSHLLCESGIRRLISILCLYVNSRHVESPNNRTVSLHNNIQAHS